MLDRLEQNLEQHGGGPSEHQDAIHRGHRPDQPPFLDGRDVAIAERGVVDECEIQELAALRRRALPPRKEGPFDPGEMILSGSIP